MLNLGSPKLSPLPIKSTDQKMEIKVNPSRNKSQQITTHGVISVRPCNPPPVKCVIEGGTVVEIGALCLACC
jgi:hypothetical protein